ncbi:NAD-dependent epimerase/dehydratase family protein [Paenibacillus arenilitoris]|uniref:NAD-dependent epimerase/dehydratase family protein n=1 Tax=Paenibacillus arenilitoris TaxID=2772299 RepID=A0A927H451_9BACL|nr:NAD-dependent epimerase/dehydratase family protein [Paenibacillus arenilitoris]MBD2867545.1 NAD-dependent epimerase/dehydratase family protein [Paenibacillus arenilitoris]
MKVLVTGGYGFIGSFVAERFSKEGYEVSIIDNLSTGNKRNVDFKHKSYILSVEDRNCEEIFRNNRFDIVIHLAAQVSVAASIENPRQDTKSNVLGLSNMLVFAHKFGVKKFIFASSAAVYGSSEQLPLPESASCSPISPYGINKMIGETYCLKWQEIYGLETLCFRFSNVFGPRQDSRGEGGVVSTFIGRALEGRELVVFGDGGQTRDFIYVEDVADAIYRSSYSDLSGVYNLSTNTEHSVNELVETIRSLHGTSAISYRDARQGDIYRSALDNYRIGNDLDWAPKYVFNEGVRRTYEWFRNERPAEPTTVKPKTEQPSLLSRAVKAFVPYAENLLAFALAAWLTYKIDDTQYNFIDVKLFYIIIIGIIYGNRQSITAVALSALLHTYQLLENGYDLISLFYGTDLFFQVAVYLFVGLVVGYSVDRRTFAARSKERQLDALQHKYSFLNEVYEETRAVKEELQLQIMNNGDSFGKIYSVTKELESLEPEKIFTSTISVLESIMKTDAVTIYTVNKYKSYLRLAARSNGNGFEAPKSIKVEATPYVKELLDGKKVYVNKKLAGDSPLLAAPVLNGGEVVAVVSLHGLKFDHFSLYYENLFKIAVDLISSSLSRALSYVEATVSQRYLEGSRVLKPEVFEPILASKRLASSKHGVEYVLLTAGSAADVSPETADQIYRSLRETDYLGLGRDGQLLILLSNSGRQDAAFVLERFGLNHINLNIVKEDLLYA